jgi:hypothetical protein
VEKDTKTHAARRIASDVTTMVPRANGSCSVIPATWR